MWVFAPTTLEMNWEEHSVLITRDLITGPRFRLLDQKLYENVLECIELITVSTAETITLYITPILIQLCEYVGICSHHARNELGRA